jgi:hypothetical protein
MRSLAALLLCGDTLAGNNGQALTPPLTWRSWNQFGWYITEDVILEAAAGLVNTERAIKGMPSGASLKDLGYDEVGMDEGLPALRVPTCTAETRTTTRGHACHA